MIRVNLSNGAYLDCTPEHKFYIWNNLQNKSVEVNANKLEANNVLINFDLPEEFEFANPEKFKHAYTRGLFSDDKTTKKLTTGIAHTEYTINETQDNYITTISSKDMVHKFSVPVNACIYDRLRWLEGQVDANGTILKNGTNESLQIASIQKDFLICFTIKSCFKF